jgi:gamma-glutamyltranspeptidase/glutathione hydrolase
MWAMLEAQGGFSSADETDRNHLMAETSMRAFADRAAWLGADFQASVPPEAIVAEQRLSRLLANFDGNRHLSPSRLTPPPVARAENPSATSFVAVDRGGSAVACSLTMNNVFGTGRVARGTGVILAAQPGNEGRGPLPLGPIMIINKIRSNLIFAGAASGGAPAPTSLAAVTARTVLAEQPLAAALRHPRIHHGGAPDITFHEPKLDAIVRAGLIGRGHRLGTTQSLGRVNAVHCPGGLTREPSGCIVAVDPRGDGLATTASQ